MPICLASSQLIGPDDADSTRWISRSSGTSANASPPGDQGLGGSSVTAARSAREDAR